MNGNIFETQVTTQLRPFSNGGFGFGRGCGRGNGHNQKKTKQVKPAPKKVEKPKGEAAFNPTKKAQFFTNNTIQLFLYSETRDGTKGWIPAPGPVYSMYREFMNDDAEPQKRPQQIRKTMPGKGDRWIALLDWEDGKRYYSDNYLHAKYGDDYCWIPTLETLVGTGDEELRYSFPKIEKPVRVVNVNDNSTGIFSDAGEDSDSGESVTTRFFGF